MENKNSVLVVDDEMGPREALRMILKGGYEIVTADSGERAIGHLAERLFDVIIVDIKMAGMDGLQLLCRIKEIKPDIEVILITGYARVETPKTTRRSCA